MRRGHQLCCCPREGDTDYVVVPEGEGGGMRGDTDYVVVPEREIQIMLLSQRGRGEG